ncbi:MAG TPA: sensor histidine kinase [Elusimicrobiales bacterium]|nr:sensor histidine kinase [Elusimicrobiales bacterium]
MPHRITSRQAILPPEQAIHALHPQVPKNEVLHALRERVKELTALHSTVCILQNDRLSTREILARVVRLIPPAWQYPEVTAGRIIVGGRESATKGFRRTRWLQACDFRISPELAGRIEVYYLKKTPAEAEGPFLAEERNLINSLADMLRVYFERKLASKALLDAHNDLEKRVKARTAELEKLNAALKAEVRERELRQKQILSYQEKLRGLSAELILTEERERREIATDLHDVIGQTLAMAKMRAGALRGRHSAAEAPPELKDLSSFIDEAILATRSLTFQLASPILYELGLESALERLAEDTRQQHGLRVEFRGDGKTRTLSTETSVLIFKAVRELIMNAVKHAKASEVKVCVRGAAGLITVTVRDNGRGFAPAAAGYGGDRRGFGLFSIREKVSRLGGAFRLESRPGAGTRAVITAPLGKGKTHGKENTDLRRP